MKVHQNVVIGGVDYGDKSSRKYSKFCNEGKWKYFIEPLLETQEGTFIEMGCNAGMYLKLAKEKGFKRVLGVEADEKACEVARRYQDGKVINAKLDFGFDYDSLPVADITLLANFHYHIFFPVFLDYVNRIRRKTRYIIIVSAGVRTTRHFPDTDLNSIRRYFRLWKEVGVIDGVSKEGDPHPRDMWSICFKSELERKPIQEILSAIGKQGARHYAMARKSTKDFPCTMPLLLLPNDRIIDGSHRLAQLVKEGETSAIVERTQ